MQEGVNKMLPSAWSGGTVVEVFFYFLAIALALGVAFGIGQYFG